MPSIAHRLCAAGQRRVSSHFVCKIPSRTRVYRVIGSSPRPPQGPRGTVPPVGSSQSTGPAVFFDPGPVSSGIPTCCLAAARTPTHRFATVNSRRVLGDQVSSFVDRRPRSRGLKWQLIPALGARRLDAITNEQVQKLKLALTHRVAKTVNNVLTLLNTLLKKAVEWNELDRLPCTIRLLKNPRKTMGFLDFEEYERLLVAARNRSPETYLMLLLGGDAGLRLGEIVALNWSDVDLATRRLTVERSNWRWARDCAHRRASAASAADPAAHGCEGVPAPAFGTGAVVVRWDADHPGPGHQGRPRRRAFSGASGLGRPHPSTQFLFAPGDERRTREGDPGTRWARRPVHDPALHARQPGGHGGRHSTAGQTGRGRRDSAANGDMMETRPNASARP